MKNKLNYLTIIFSLLLMAGNTAFLCTHSPLVREEKLNRFAYHPRNKGFFIEDNEMSSYKDGRTLKQYYCKNCGVEVSYFTGIAGMSRCMKCSSGKNHYRYKEKITLICQQCNKEYEVAPYLSKRKFCSKKCYANWRSNEESYKIYYCKEPNCNNQIHYATWKVGSGRCRKCSVKKTNIGKYVRSKKTRSLISLAYGGTGIPYENSIYPEEFNNRLKNKIKKRDNYTCQKCGLTTKGQYIKYNSALEVHHIDYDKENNKEDNLITLCKQCNIRANKNRKYWKDYFKKVLIIIKNNI